MCLEAQAHVHLNDPSLTFRIHQQTKDESLRMALEVVRLGGGFPYLVSDNAVITGLLAMGIPLTSARNWADIGCQEVLLDPNMVPGVDSNGRTNTGFTNMVKPIELALWNGYNPVKDLQAGPQTGDPRTFKTFAEFETAVKKQFEHAIRHNVIYNNVREALVSRYHPHIFHDLLHPGPRNSGIDIDAGGCAYNWAGNLNVGAANAGDIMTAIDYLIYETKQVTWDELLDALHHNWEGYETVRQKCLSAPKYGIGNTYADDHTREVLETFFTTWESFNVPRSFDGSAKRGPFTSGLISMSYHVIWGEVTGATPDGRKAGEPLASACTPSNYAPALGPAATHLSVARAIDTAHTVNGIIFNQKFSPTSVLNERELSKWMDLVKTYIDLGGQQVNYNIVSGKTLLDAQAHPKQYLDLFVRVGGYSARFVDLSKELQDEIIARAEHSL
jgi:formate C-acetyltransferase